MTVAKALGGGLPIGALITGERLADTLPARRPRLDVRRRPVVAAAALAALDGDRRLRRCWRACATSASACAPASSELPGVAGVRGRGLMVGFDLEHGDAPELVLRALAEQRLILNATGPPTVRLLPPLTIDEAIVDDALARIGRLLTP